MSKLEMKYFVLKPRGSDRAAFASRRAMLEYAKIIQESDPELAESLREWVERETL